MAQRLLGFETLSVEKSKVTFFELLGSQGNSGSPITSQSLVRIQFPPLEFAVAKFACRWVIRRADVERRRPFCILSPVRATTCGDVVRREVSVTRRRAIFVDLTGGVLRTRFESKLSPISASRASWVIRGCDRSMGRNANTWRPAMPQVNPVQWPVRPWSESGIRIGRNNALLHDEFGHLMHGKVPFVPHGDKHQCTGERKK